MEKKLSPLRTRRDKRLLKAASKLLITRGIEAGSMEEIAAEAGVTRQTLYRYYRSKEELLCAVEAEQTRRISTRLSELFTGDIVQLSRQCDQLVQRFVIELGQELIFTALFEAHVYGTEAGAPFRVSSTDEQEIKNPFTKILSQTKLPEDPTVTAEIGGRMLLETLLILSRRSLLRHGTSDTEETAELISVHLRLLLKSLQAA